MSFELKKKVTMAIVNNANMAIVGEQENYTLNEVQLSCLIEELVNILPIQRVILS